MFFLLWVLISEVSMSPANLSVPMVSDAGWLKRQGFPVIWNMPTKRCLKSHTIRWPIHT